MISRADRRHVVELIDEAVTAGARQRKTPSTHCATMLETLRRLGVTSSFSRWCNTEHKHNGLKFTTPEQRHTGEATVILEHRQQVYREARVRHPNRWSGDIRNWVLPEKVWLNPEKEPSDLNQAA